MAESLSVNGVTAEQVYETARKVGVSDADAKLLVSNWIYQSYLTLGRTFAYATNFPAAMPECVPPPFVRSFVHKDWVDGEDLVQAGQTANDDGFNVRLHQIEHDLDALGAKIAKIADCMADMRSTLKKMFDEIAAELNRVDNDLGGTVKGPIVIGTGHGGYVYGNLPHYQYPVATPANPGVVISNPATVYPSYTGVLPPGTDSDPMLSYLGTTIFQEKAVSLFNTSQGIMILPAVDLSTPAAVDKRVGAAGAFARAALEDKRLQQAMRKEVDKDTLVQRFGDQMLTNGQTLAQVLAVLPAGAKYKNSDEMLADLSARMAGALQSTTGLARQLAATVSAPANATSLASVDLSGMKNLPPLATAALRKAGVATIGQFAGAALRQVTDIINRSGADLSAGEIAAAQGTAQTLAQMEVH